MTDAEAASLKKGGDAMAPGGKSRIEFVLATPQKGEPKADLAMLNLAANTVRLFAKLIHMQNVRVNAGETVQFSKKPKPIFLIIKEQACPSQKSAIVPKPMKK